MYHIQRHPSLSFPPCHSSLCQYLAMSLSLNPPEPTAMSLQWSLLLPSVDVRDRDYLPVGLAIERCHKLGPEGLLPGTPVRITFKLETDSARRIPWGVIMGEKASWGLFPQNTWYLSPILFQVVSKEIETLKLR